MQFLDLSLRDCYRFLIGVWCSGLRVGLGPIQKTLCRGFGPCGRVSTERLPYPLSKEYALDSDLFRVPSVI